MGGATKRATKMATYQVTYSTKTAIDSKLSFSDIVLVEAETPDALVTKVVDLLLELVVKIKRKSPGRPQTFQHLAQLGEGSICLILSTRHSRQLSCGQHRR